MKADVDIGIAVLALKAGRRIARRGWNGKDMWLALQVPDAESKMTLPSSSANGTGSDGDGSSDVPTVRRP
jgi:hypothetical protein